MKGMNFAGFLLVCMVVFFSGAAFGRRSAVRESAEAAANKAKLSDVLEVSGVVWHSQQDKVWRFRHGDGRNFLPYELSKTEGLAEMVADLRARHAEGGRTLYDHCSYAVGLKVRIPKPPYKIKPGYQAVLEIVELGFVKTDFCFHCPHALKAPRE